MTEQVQPQQFSSTVSGVVYSSPPGFRPLELDLYLPQTATAAAPVIMFIHGGGWRVGSRRSFGPAYQDWQPSAFRRLADAGFVVATVDYRLSAEAIFPAQLEDLQAAARWLGEHSAEFGIDPARIVIWGESAGGHLAALLALTTSTDSGESAGFRIVGVVDWYGPADLNTMQSQSRSDAGNRPDASDSRESQLIGAPLAASPELAAAASPVTYVTAAAPEFFLVHGDADRFVSCEQSQQLADLLAAAGVAHRLRIVEGADHMWRDTNEAPDIFADSLAFAQRVAAPPQ